MSLCEILWFWHDFGHSGFLIILYKILLVNFLNLCIAYFTQHSVMDMHRKFQIKIFNTKEMIVLPNFSCYIFFRRHDFGHSGFARKCDGNAHKAALYIRNTFYTFNSLFILHLKCIATYIIQHKWCNGSEICPKIVPKLWKGFSENPFREVRENDHFFGIDDFDLKFSVHVHNTMLSEVSYSPMFYIMYIA